MRVHLLLVVLLSLAVIGCGEIAQTDASQRPSPAESAPSGTLSAVSPDFVLPAGEVPLPAEDGDSTTTAIQGTAPTESAASGRPVIVSSSQPMRVDLPSGLNGEPSVMVLSVVRLEDEDVPFLQLDTAAASSAGEQPMWFVTIDGGRLSKFNARSGGTYGVRLSNETAVAGVTVAIWSQELDGAPITEPVEVLVKGEF